MTMNISFNKPSAVTALNNNPKPAFGINPQFKNLVQGLEKGEVDSGILQKLRAHMGRMKEISPEVSGFLGGLSPRTKQILKAHAPKGAPVLDYLE